ncbi:hypothetical protein BDQ17DRAFT_1547650 [Cyathus striatus]|nr:hypothetical protein BDQ17DRAFT_1547650 [Cyathus striatus]
MHASTVVLALALSVYAQSTTDSATTGAPTDTSGVSPCLLQCVTTAATDAGCSSFSDIACVCASDSFQASALSCLQDNCTPADLTAAQALQQQECGATSASASGTDTDTAGATSASASGSVTGTAISTTTAVSLTTSTAPVSGSSAASLSRSSVASGSSAATSSRATSSAVSSAASSGAASSASSAGGKVELMGMGGIMAGVVAVVGGLVGAFAL